MKNTEEFKQKIVGALPAGDSQTKNSKKIIAVVGADDSVRPQKGITLIALIITIIVMLILVGVTISVSLNGGLFEKSKGAKNDTIREMDREELYSAVVYAYDSRSGEISKTGLENDLKKRNEKWKVEGNAGGPYTVTSPENNVFIVDTYGKIIDKTKEDSEEQEEQQEQQEQQEAETNVWIAERNLTRNFTYDKIYEGEVERYDGGEKDDFHFKLASDGGLYINPGFSVPNKTDVDNAIKVNYCSLEDNIMAFQYEGEGSYVTLVLSENEIEFYYFTELTTNITEGTVPNGVLTVTNSEEWTYTNPLLP